MTTTHARKYSRTTSRMARRSPGKPSKGGDQGGVPVTFDFLQQLIQRNADWRRERSTIRQGRTT